MGGVYLLKENFAQNSRKKTKFVNKNKVVEVGYVWAGESGRGFPRL